MHASRLNIRHVSSIYTIFVLHLLSQNNLQLTTQIRDHAVRGEETEVNLVPVESIPRE